MKTQTDDTLFMDEEDELFFSDHDESTSPSTPTKTWKILVVDDEPEIHHVTKMVLDDFTFENRALQFMHAYTGAEAIELMIQHHDVAVVLLDVVMERDDAGLQVVKYIREQLSNHAVRIILRTGQPGQAPEKNVILHYDINDYKEKTELTSTKLYTTIIASLRSYRDITLIEQSKASLQCIVEAAPNIFKIQSLQSFFASLLQQLSSMLHLNNDCVCDGLVLSNNHHYHYLVVAGIGQYERYQCEKLGNVVEPDLYRRIEQVFMDKASHFDDEHIICHFQSQFGEDKVIYLHAKKQLSPLDHSLLSIFCSNVAVAFENLYLNEELENTQREIIFTLGEIAETRSEETGFHVKRVAEFSKLLALRAGLTEDEAEMLRLSSPLHDVGKVGIPDNILNKPGKLTNEEFELMKQHAVMGYDMLKGSNGPIMKIAAVIAKEHHEKYDGTGYPDNMRGEDIHIYARIVAIADVFDALSSERVYKPAWSYERIQSLFLEEKGKHFDPKLIDIFLQHYDEFIAIREKYSDIKVF